MLHETQCTNKNRLMLEAQVPLFSHTLIAKKRQSSSHCEKLKTLQKFKAMYVICKI